MFFKLLSNPVCFLNCCQIYNVLMTVLFEVCVEIARGILGVTKAGSGVEKQNNYFHIHTRPYLMSDTNVSSGSLPLNNTTVNLANLGLHWKDLFEDISFEF